jgi:hypothetical protein
LLFGLVRSGSGLVCRVVVVVVVFAKSVVALLSFGGVSMED